MNLKRKTLLSIIIAVVMTFGMIPMIGASTANAVAYPEITLEFGTGHEALAAVFADYMNEDESPIPGCDAAATGSKVNFFYLENGDYSLGDVHSKISRILLDFMYNPYDYMDNGDLLHSVSIGFEGSCSIGQKTLDKYSDDSDLNNEVAESYENELPDKQTFYVLWDKPIKNVSLSVKPPVCGVETKENPDETQTNPPQVTITGKNYSFDWPSIWYALSDPNDIKWFSGIFKGGKDYAVNSNLKADFGYFFPEGVKYSIEGGVIVSPKDLPEIGKNPNSEMNWFGIFYRVKAVHAPGAPVKENIVKPTCTKNGSYDSVAYCKACKKEASRVKKTIKATGHKWGKWTVTKKATTKAKGQKQRTCAKCGAVQKRSIPKLKAPSQVLMAKVIAKGNTALKVKWSKIKAAAGYDIFMSRCNYNNKVIKVKKIKTIRKNKTFKWTASELEENTCYKICVKAFKMKNGKKKYFKKSPLVHAFTDNFGGDFTNVRKVMVKKKKVVLEKGDSFKIKAKLSKQIAGKKLPKTHAPKLRYISSDKKVAKVTRKGKIKAVKAGKAKIYVFAHNGVSKTVKVEVK